MPRDSSGTYTPSPSSPFVTNTPITASAANQRASDLTTEITDSLSRSGKGGMLAPLLFTGIAATIKGGIADGASAVGVILDNAVALANAAAKAVSIRVNGVEKAYFDKDGALSGASAAATVKGTAADGATAVGVILDAATELANASAKLLSVRNAGVEKSYFDKDGVLFMGGVQATSKTYVDGKFTTATWTTTAPGAAEWTNGASNESVAYWKDAAGIVHLRGKVTASATPSSTILGGSSSPLPAGYRPLTARYFYAVKLAGATYSAAIVSVASTGTVTLANGSPTPGDVFYLDSVIYPAEQ